MIHYGFARALRIYARALTLPTPSLIDKPDKYEKWIHLTSS